MKKADLNKRIGRSIIDQRLKLGWSQSDLARACHKDRQSIEKLENGKVNPTLYTLYEVAKAMDISFVQLMDFKM